MGPESTLFIEQGAKGGPQMLINQPRAHHVAVPEVYVPFNCRADALAHLGEVLGSVAGQALVIVSSEESWQELLRVQVGRGQRVQSVERVPSQRDRQGISIASYRTVRQVMRAPCGGQRIDRDAQELVVFDNPHRLAPPLIRTLRSAFPPTQPTLAITTHASLAAERYMREIFSGRSGITLTKAPTTPQGHTPSLWSGERVAKDWTDQANCSGDGFDPRFQVRKAKVWDAIRQRDCPGCPVADSCLAAGLTTDHQMANKRQRLWGAWGGLTESARRELRAALYHGASTAEAAYMVERARERHTTNAV
jgi:hypothetical protein